MTGPKPRRRRRTTAASHRLLVTARTLSALGDFMVPAAMAVAITGKSGSAADIGGVLACALVPRLVLLPISGVLADRLDPRRVAIGADLVRIVTQSVIGLDFLGSGFDLKVIAVAQFVAGAAAACSLPTTWPLVVAAVAQDDRRKVNARLSAARSAAMLLGPGLAGTVMLTVGPALVFLLDAAAFACSAALLALVRVHRVPAAASTFWFDLLEGWTEIRSRVWYWASLVVHASWNLASGVLLTLGPPIAMRELGGNAVWIATLQTGGVGMLVGSVLSSRARLRRPVLAGNLGLAGYCVPLLLFAARAPAPLVIGAYGLALGLLGFFNPLWDSTVQALLPRHVLARVTAYDLLLSLAAQPLGLVLGPALAARTGTAVPLLGSAAVLAGAVVVTAALPQVRLLTLAHRTTERL